MSRVNLEQLKSAIRDIPDFPKPGIVFKDITPILGDGQLFQSVIDYLAEEAQKVNPTKVVGIDARGFLFGAAVAYKLGLGCVPIRKKGKLPFKTIGSSYQLEYGGAKVEMHVALHSRGYFFSKVFCTMWDANDLDWRRLIEKSGFVNIFHSTIAVEEM